VHVHGDRLDPQESEGCERSSRREVVLTRRLKAKLKELNPDANENTLDKAVRKVTSLQGASLLGINKAFHHDLISNISIEQETGSGRRNLTVRFIDFDDPKNNEFLVVDQFSIKGPKVTDRPDIVIFVNGIPLAVIECKSPIARETGVTDAVEQLLRYQREIPSLFYANQIVVGINLFKAKYATIGATSEDFHEWKAKSEEKLPILTDHPCVKEMLELKAIETSDLPRTPAAQDVLIAALFNKNNFLDIIRNFIVFDTQEGKVTKKICRYQQFAAVQKIARRVLEEKEKKGIIWHWQGSGKSLTMLFAALKLRREDERLKNPYFLIVTDRRDLDRQIAGTFQDCGFPDPVRAESSSELYQLLSAGVGRTIMTTVQKFRTQPEAPLSTAQNIIVLTDEAHRTQYGNLAFNLRKALPNAVFLAFTGTPLDKQDRNTYRLFSPEGERYLDRYDIHQAQEDGATVPMKYSGRLASLHLIGASLDALLTRLFPDADKSELARIKQRYATIDTLATAPARIERIALDILEHYNQTVKPNGFKAMIVAESRAMADLYKQALDKFADPSLSAVIMTSDERNDPEEWKIKYRLTQDDEQRFKKKFEDPTDPLCFLIVCDKLLTGFDAPILQAMYLDKRLKEHTLLQAVARTNRTHPGKNHGLIVDYVGIDKELAKTLEQFDAQELQGLFRADDVERELKCLEQHRQTFKSIFVDVTFDAPSRDIIQQCLDILKDEKIRGEFDLNFRAFTKSMDFLMPDLRVEPYLKDFRLLGVIREGAKNLFNDERLSMDIDFSRKVKGLIHAHIVSEGIETLLEPLIITSVDFSQRLDEKGSDRTKTIYLEHALRASIKSFKAQNPVFFGSLQDRLEEIIKDQDRSRRDDAETLRTLLEIKKEIEQTEATAKKMGLDSAMQFAFYGSITDHKTQIHFTNQQEQADLAKKIIDIVRERAVTGWVEREDVQKEMRREIKRLLRDTGCAEGDLASIVREMIELAQHHINI
ncbi:MAG: type I restriction endonuclease subunit R, partial [Elusimicrobiota bacterium]